mgnify:CR=1 FL=1
MAYLRERIKSVSLSSDQASISLLRLDKVLFHQWLAYYLQREHHVQAKLFIKYIAIVVTKRTNRQKVEENNSKNPKMVGL